MTSPVTTWSPARTRIGWALLSTWAYQVTRFSEGATITIQALGRGSYGLAPAKRTTPGPAARIGVYIGAAMSMPLWKWAQLPFRGSQANPVQPYSWGIVPLIGQTSVPLYFEGMLPRRDCSATRRAISFWSAFSAFSLAAIALAIAALSLDICAYAACCALRSRSVSFSSA